MANAPAVAGGGGEVALGGFFSIVPGDPWTAEDFFSQGKLRRINGGQGTVEH